MNDNPSPYCEPDVEREMLSQETFDKIKSFCKEHPTASGSFAHIVLDDNNVSDGDIKWCVNLLSFALGLEYELDQDDIEWAQKRMKWHEDNWEYSWDKEIAMDEFVETRDFLLSLLEIPENIR